MITSLVLSSCHVYEDNFTDEGKYYKELFGYYGESESCKFPWIEEEPAQVSLMESFRVLDKACGIAEVKKDNQTFTLNPTSDTCKKYHTEKDGEESFEFIGDFSIKVSKLSKNKISIQMPTGEPKVFQRCTHPNK